VVLDVTDFDDRVSAAVRAVEVVSAKAFSWFGKRSPRMSTSVQRSLTADAARSLLLFNLQNRLYRDFYCSGRPRPATPAVANPATKDSGEFIEGLSRANSGAGFWSAGWIVRATEAEKIAVQRNGLELFVHADECRFVDGAAPDPGTSASIRYPKEVLGASPGFYMAMGNTELATDDPQNLIRLYLNTTPNGALHFMHVLTRRLNEARLPFQLKVVNEPTRFDRCDAMVLYLRKDGFSAVAKQFCEISDILERHLQAETTAFTKILAPGLGLAEDPGGGESFGMSRCRLLAEGLVRAHELGERSETGRLRVIGQCFADAGISLDAPFLNPGSTDRYDLPHSYRREPVGALAPVGEGKPDRRAYHRVARELGEKLLQQAVWHQDRCTWLGTQPASHRWNGGDAVPSYRSLGPDLYSGTAGVALFLADLFTSTGDTRVCATARGAIRQALANVDAVPAAVRSGLYTGWPGIAVAASYLGAVLGDEDLQAVGSRLFRRAVLEGADGKEADLLSGVAGAIVAAMILHDIRGEAWLLELAAGLGDDLLRAANESSAGYSWRSAHSAARHDLTGFSHGVAGIGYALRELSLATDDARYADAATHAFRYERQWYDQNRRNWADLRDVSSRHGRRNRLWAFGSTWCHGAPGIAISRLRAFEILKDAACKAEAIAAVATTGKTIEQWLRGSGTNFSLCHGLAGNAEVLVYASEALGEPSAEHSKLAIKVANAGVARYGRHNHRWPCGTGGGETPGLMLGLAGIGRFYLRMSDPAVPSLLCWRSGSFRR
jgi:hypothetical protein